MHKHALATRKSIPQSCRPAPPLHLAIPEYPMHPASTCGSARPFDKGPRTKKRTLPAHALNGSKCADPGADLRETLPLASSFRWRSKPSTPRDRRVSPFSPGRIDACHTGNARPIWPFALFRRPSPNVSSFGPAARPSSRANLGRERRPPGLWARNDAPGLFSSALRALQREAKKPGACVILRLRSGPACLKRAGCGLVLPALTIAIEAANPRGPVKRGVT